MSRKIYSSISFLFILLLITSCSDDFIGGLNGVDNYKNKNLASVSVRLNTPGAYQKGVITETRTMPNGFEYEAKEVPSYEITRTLASETYDVTSMSDVWSLQYDKEGYLVESQYSLLTKDGDKADFSIKVDTTIISDIYFLVNTHDSMLIDSRRCPGSLEKLRNMQDTIESENWCESRGIPMYGFVENLDFKKKNEDAKTLLNSISIKRSVACLSVNVLVKEGFKASSVQLCNVPGSYNIICADSLQTSRYRTNFESHLWDDSDVEDVVYKGANYKKKKFTWYIPGYCAPAYNTERTYISIDASSPTGAGTYVFRLYNETRSPKISPNTMYEINAELSIFKSYGDSTTDAVIVCPTNIAWNPKTNSYDLANCYVANTQNGTMKNFVFPVGQYQKYANAVAKKEKLPALATMNWHPEIVWQTNKENVDVELGSYTGYGDGTISINVQSKNSDPSKCWSNVLIRMVSDDNLSIVWSWHIWITPRDVLNETFELGGKTFMAYELGASKSILVSPDNGNNYPTNLEEWGESLGLYYQWGRKDPFRGAFGSATSVQCMYDHVQSRTAITTWGTLHEDYVKSGTTTNYTLDRTQTVANPQCFWVGSTSWMGQGRDFLNYDSWKEVKTIFDPSPPGYRVVACSELDPIESSISVNPFLSDPNGKISPSSTWVNKLTSASDLKTSTCPYFYFPLKSKEGDYVFIPAGGFINTNGNIVDIALRGTFEESGYGDMEAAGGFWTVFSDSGSDVYVWGVASSASYLFYCTMSKKGNGVPVIMVKE